MNALEQAFRFYLEHQNELVAKYNGKVIAIADDTVLGAFDSEGEAAAAISKDRPMGTFLLQLVAPGEAAYTQTFHTRAAFA